MQLSRSLTLAILGPGLAALLVLGGCDRQSAAPAQPEANKPRANEAGAPAPKGAVDRSHRGSRMPDLTLRDPEGRTLRMPDLVGKPVVLNLWATWCAPCIAEMPGLDALAAAQGDRIRVVTVSQDMQGAKLVTPFLAKHRLSHLEPWLDPDNDLAFFFGGAQLPTTVVYDAQGREVWRMTGGHDWASGDTPALLAEAGIAAR